MAESTDRRVDFACINCGKWMGEWPATRYCSPQCRMISAGLLAGQQPVRTCLLAECGVEFQPKSRTQKCCCEYHGKLNCQRRRRATGLESIEVACAFCGTMTVKSKWPGKSRKNRFCSLRCRDDFAHADERAAKAIREAELVVEHALHSVVLPLAVSGTYCAIPPSHPARSGRFRHRRRWIALRCAHCDSPFLACGGQRTARYCSTRCMKLAGKKDYREKLLAQGISKFQITKPRRLAIYKRDNWICQLCWQPVDAKLPWLDPMAATLDHIVCQSWVEKPDHSSANLRLAHRSCNLQRGDEGRWAMTEAGAFPDPPADISEPDSEVRCDQGIGNILVGRSGRIYEWDDSVGGFIDTGLWDPPATEGVPA